MGYLFSEFIDKLAEPHLRIILLAVAAALVYVALAGSLRAKRTATKALP